MFKLWKERRLGIWINCFMYDFQNLINLRISKDRVVSKMSTKIIDKPVFEKPRRYLENFYLSSNKFLYVLGRIKA